MAIRVYLEIHEFKRALEMLEDLREKVMLGTLDNISVLTEIDAIYEVLDNTKVEEE